MISLVSFLAVVVPFSAMQIAAQPAVAPQEEVATRSVVVAPATPVVAAEPAVVAAPARVEAAVEAVEAVEAASAPEVFTSASEAGEATPAVESTPVTVTVEATSASAEATAEPAVEAASAPPAAMRILTLSDIGSRSFRVLDTVEGRACTLKLKRPVNTGDTSRNPAEALATERVLKNAAAQGADAVTNLKCAREIRIGLSCPTAVTCQADAIRFE